MKKLIIILIITSIYINTGINGFCNENDKYINIKVNKFIDNKIESKYILYYLDYNYSNIEDERFKKIIINKFIIYNEKHLDFYQLKFDNLYEQNVANLQTKQNLKSELNILNDIYNYNDINKHKFNFIDNKPKIVSGLREMYLSGYKIIVRNNKFKLKVNYDLLKKSY